MREKAEKASAHLEGETTVTISDICVPPDGEARWVGKDEEIRVKLTE